MKKKLIALIAIVALVAALTVGLVACDKGGDKDTMAITDLKVGALYITSKTDHTGYTFAHNSGITSAMEELGMSSDQLIIEDNIVDSDNDANIEAAIDRLVAKNVDMIIGISFGYQNVMQEKAEEYPDVIFSHGTGYLNTEDNMNSYFGRIYQSRYLAGVAAGLKAKELNNPNIGYVTAFAANLAETASGINAFILGAQSVYPEAVLKVKSLQGWFHATNERQYALDLIDDGCGVIAQHCDSAAPQIAAQEQGAFGCGYNSDMAGDAPQAHLTSPIWHWNVYYKQAFEAATKSINDGVSFNSVIGRYWYEGLNAGFVDIAPLTDNCSVGTADAINKVKDMMIAWEQDHNSANGFNVFEGAKLNITIDDEGVATVAKVDADMKNNKGTVVIASGAASVDDSVIKSYMNYMVEGITVVLGDDTGFTPQN